MNELTSPVARVNAGPETTNIHGTHGPSWTLCKASPDGRHVASFATPNKLAVRDSRTLTIIRVLPSSQGPFTSVPISLQWSPDSMFLLACFRRAQTTTTSSSSSSAKSVVCEVFPACGSSECGVASDDWRCVIAEGSAGLSWAVWAPDSRHIVTCCDFGIRATVWSLVRASAVAYVPLPKSSLLGASCVAFGSRGSFAAVATRRNCRDYVVLLSCSSWQQIAEFPVSTDELSGLCFAPDDSSLCCWGSMLESVVLLYDLEGREILQLSVGGSSETKGLGVECVEWAPNGAIIAVGCCDESVVLVNPLSGKVAAEIAHPHEIPPLPDGSSVFVQMPQQPKFAIVQPPIALAGAAKPRELQPGIDSLKWAPARPLLAVHNECTPGVIWVWDLPRMCPLAVIVNNDGVKDFAWAPHGDTLAFCVGSDNLLRLWSPEAGCQCISVGSGADSFRVQKLSWIAGDGDDGKQQVMLCDRDAFCCCRV